MRTSAKNGKDQPSAKNEPCENFPLFSNTLLLGSEFMHKLQDGNKTLKLHSDHEYMLKLYATMTTEELHDHV